MSAFVIAAATGWIGLSSLPVSALDSGGTWHVIEILRERCGWHLTHMLDAGSTITLIVVPALAAAVALAVAVRIQLLALVGMVKVVPANDPSGRLATACSKYAIESPVVLIDDDRLSAFVAGLKTSKILISSGAVASLTDRELAAVLVHEQAHLVRRDHKKQALSSVLAYGLFMFPVVGCCARRVALQRELSADATAIDRVGLDALAGALLKFVGGAARPAQYAIGFATSDLGARVEALRGEHALRVFITKTAVIQTVGSTLFLAAALLITTMVP